jgi:hypothetical protein
VKGWITAWLHTVFRLHEVFSFYSAVSIINLC